jgi:hypothetical protein
MESKEKIKTFPLRVEWGLIEELRTIMKDYGFTKVSPFIRMILINFKNENMAKNSKK